MAHDSLFISYYARYNMLCAYYVGMSKNRYQTTIYLHHIEHESGRYNETTIILD